MLPGRRAAIGSGTQSRYADLDETAGVGPGSGGGARGATGDADLRVRVRDVAFHGADAIPPNWLAARNLSNEASDESVRALIEAVRGRFEIPRRWYRLKAQLLGVRGVCVIGHGSSNDRAIFNGIRVAYEFAHAGTNERIEQEFLRRLAS